ncbi:sulfotransferase family protein [Myxosarcina sp. GI1(2024)]
MSMPNFCIIGAAKSGTTSLYQYLNQHPQVYMSPVKEPRFFGLEEETPPNFRGPRDEYTNRILIKNIDDYQALFQEVKNEKAIGEASPWYLYLEKAPLQIKRHIPEIKLIAILRNPVDRAYSSFLHQLQRGAEPLNNFAEALDEEKTRICQHWRPIWHYKQCGFYYQQLNRYYGTFDPEQIQVYLYEDFCDRPIDLLQDIFRFLEVDDTFTPDVSRRYNVTYLPSNQTLKSLVNSSNSVKSRLKSLLPTWVRQSLKGNVKVFHNYSSVKSAKPKLSLELRRQLIEEYREEILKLQVLIQKDLSHWLTC